MDTLYYLLISLIDTLFYWPIVHSNWLNETIGTAVLYENSVYGQTISYIVVLFVFWWDVNIFPMYVQDAMIVYWVAWVIVTVWNLVKKVPFVGVYLGGGY